MLRLGLVGCGRMGRLHARRLMERPDARLVAVLDPSGVPEGLPGVDHLPTDLDAVIVATPARTHAEVVRALGGVAVLVEKPLATSIAEAEALARHPRLSVGHIERFNPTLAALPRMARYLRAERLAPFAERGTDVDVILDLMIHDLDLALQLCGSAKEVRAVGVSVRTGGPDIAEAWIEAEGGTAVLAASRVSAKSSRKLRLVSEEGYWSADLSSRVVERTGFDLASAPVEVPPGDALVSMHDAFLAAVRSGGPMPVPGEAGLAAVELALRVRERVP